MKRFMTSAMVFAVFAMAAFVLTPVVNGAGRTGGKGGKAYNGIEGTIGEISGSAFTMTTTTASKDKNAAPYVFVVKCDANTKFMSNGQPAKASDVVKPGAHVAVQGGQSGHDLMATIVSVGEAMKKGK